MVCLNLSHPVMIFILRVVSFVSLTKLCPWFFLRRLPYRACRFQYPMPSFAGTLGQEMSIQWLQATVGSIRLSLRTPEVVS